MTPRIDFFVAGKPVPQPRPRAQIRWISGKPVPHIYTPDADVVPWRKSVAFVASGAFKYAPLEGPLRLCLAFILPRLEKHFNTTKTYGRRLRTDAPSWHAQKEQGDSDNLAKAVMDALNGVLFVDDGQVCQLYVEKRWSAVGETTGVRIVLTETIDDHIPEPVLFQEAEAQ